MYCKLHTYRKEWSKYGSKCFQIVMLKLRLEDYNGAKESMEVLAEAFPDLPESQEKVNYCADILREIHLNMAVSG